MFQLVPSSIFDKCMIYLVLNKIYSLLTADASERPNTVSAKKVVLITTTIKVIVPIVYNILKYKCHVLFFFSYACLCDNNN